MLVHLDIRAVLRLQVQSKHSKKVEVQRLHIGWRPMSRVEMGEQILELELRPARGMVQEQLEEVALPDCQNLVVLRRTALRRQRVVKDSQHHKS